MLSVWCISVDVRSCGRQEENGRSEIPAKKTNDVRGKEAIQALLFPLALTVYLETVHQPNRSSDKPHCHIGKRHTNYRQRAMLLLYGDSAISSLFNLSITIHLLSYQ